MSGDPKRIEVLKASYLNMKAQQIKADPMLREEILRASNSFENRVLYAGLTQEPYMDFRIAVRA